MGGGPERDLAMLLSLCNTRRDVPQVLNPSILISLTLLKIVGLRILSEGRHLVLLRPNLSIIRLQITISDDLPAALNR